MDGRSLCVPSARVLARTALRRFRIGGLPVRQDEGRCRGGGGEASDGWTDLPTFILPLRVALTLTRLEAKTGGASDGGIGIPCKRVLRDGACFREDAP